MNNSDKEYWASRIDNVFDQNYHRKTLEKMYRESYYAVEADILALYDKLQKKGQLTTTELYQYQRFLSLRQELSEQCGETATRLNAHTTKVLTKAYKDTFQTVEELLPGQAAWGIQNQHMLNKVLNKKWCGSNFSSRIWNNSDAVARDVESAVVSCVTRGVSKDVYVKMIKDRYNVGFSKADRLVRTELMHTINEAQKDTYRSEGVTEVEWLAAKDERMCAVCGSMHEKRFKIDDAPALAHANCRCTIIPVIDSMISPKNVDNSGKSDIIKVHQGKQDKHILGTNNYVEGKSYLTISNKEIESIIKAKSGTGVTVGNKEQIVADKIIGVNINTNRGYKTLTDTAHIHSSKNGKHLVPTHTQLRTKSISELNIYAKKIAMDYYDMPEYVQLFGKLTDKEKEQRISLLLSQKTSKTALIKDIKSMEKKILKCRGDIK